MNKDAQKKISKARTALLLDNPFFGTLTLRLRMEENPALPTAGTDGKSMFYNPSFINALPDDQLRAVLAHEVMHVALLHHTRRGSRDARKWNVAADLAINPILEKSGFALPPGALNDPQLYGQTAEQIYNMIPNPPPSQGQGQGSGAPSEGDDPGGMGSVMDAPGDGSESSKAQAEESAKIATQQAAQAAKSCGNIPAGIKRMIHDILNPLIPWREILNRFVKSAAKNDYTWTRPNRRYISQGIYLPSLFSEQLDDVVVAIDTSGSIDREALDQFSGELSAILEEYDTTVTVIYCDAAIQGVETYGKADLPLRLEPRGGGGTSFDPPFEYVRENNLQPSVFIYFTDLECWRFPDDPGYPVLWAVYGSCETEVPFGEKTRIQ